MHSLEAIITANRFADRLAREAKVKAGQARTKAGEVAAERYHAKQIKLDKAGRLVR